MSSFPAQRRINLPPIYSNESFGLRFTLTLAPGDTFTYTGQEIRLLLDPKNGTRVTLASPSSDIVVSNGGLTLDITKDAAWTLANLTPGEWTYSLFVGTTARDCQSSGTFQVIEPPGGPI